MNKVEELEALVKSQAESQAALTEQLATQAEAQNVLMEQIVLLQKSVPAAAKPVVKLVRAKRYAWSKKDCNDIHINNSPANEAEAKRQGYKKAA